ncbi:MAG: hypothetical protein DRQ35_06060, partial [Gammaproteobacteria bacterium]
MTQEFLLNTDSINSTTSKGGKNHAVNSNSDTKDEGHKAFSTELDKHIDKQDSADKTTASDIKAKDKHQQQVEQSENKNGNSLPDEQLIAEEIENTEVEQNTEDTVIVGGEIELDAEAIESVQPFGQHHTAVSQVKESLTKVSDAIVADGHKNIKKIVSAEQVVVSRQNTETLNQNKQQQETPKIRPDILQALSARLMGKDSENNPVKSDVKTLLTAEQFMDKKPVFKELQLTELIKTMVSDKVQPASQTVDKSSNNIANAFINTLVPSVTESVARSDVPSLDIQPSVQSKAWNRVLSGRVIWMAREGIQQATLKLNPANLGPVEVKLTMNDEKVHVTFIAQHAATRDALEQALPRLRDSFIENGLEFADADVLQHDFEQADNSQADNESVNTETE